MSVASVTRMHTTAIRLCPVVTLMMVVPIGPPTVVWGTTDGDTVVWETSCGDPGCEPVVWNNP